MIKKYLFKAFICIGVALSSLGSYADEVKQKVVEVVWPFNAGSASSNLTRTVIEVANARQKKYLFLFINRPGAGGAIATNYVNINNGTIKALSHSTSFWTRIKFSSEGGYDVNDFMPISYHCTDNALSLVSTKYKTLDELLEKKINISIGITPGSTTTLIPVAIAKSKPGIEFTIIPYTGSPEATINVLGGHIDSGVEFIGPAQAQPKLNILGVTGTKPIAGIPTFASLGIKGLEHVSNSYFILLPKFTDPTIVADLTSILLESSKHESVRTACTNLPGIPFSGDTDEVTKLFDISTIFWKNQHIVKQQ